MNGENQDLVFDQQELVEMIFNLGLDVDKDISPAYSKGLQVYRNNLLMTAKRSLALTYPVIEKMLGDDAMLILARDLLKLSPPVSGIWAEWGGQLAALIAKTSLIEDYPFLVDVARLEWCIHQSSRSSYLPLETATLTKLSSENTDSLKFIVASSLSLLRSSFPIDDFWYAHQPEGESIIFDQITLENAISHFEGERYLMVYQYHQLPRIKQISKDEFCWMEDVINGLSLAGLLARHPKFDFSAWLSQSINENYLEGLS